jgi:zinc and cadmium transporter
MMVGLLVMFFLLRAFHFHHHGPAEEEYAVTPDGLPVVDDSHAACDHDHDHRHDGGENPYDAPAHDHAHEHGHHRAHGHDHGHGEQQHHLSWIGVAFGLALHTAIDGIALAASVVAEAQHGEGTWLLGLGTFLAVVLHKPLDAMSITSLMGAGGWSKRSQLLVNGFYALMCPLGALLFYFGVADSEHQGALVGGALAFSAGVFVCISLGDLLPELSFHSHDRVKLSASLVAGVAVAYAIGFIEPGHAHHGHNHPAEQHKGHDRAGHEH